MSDSPVVGHRLAAGPWWLLVSGPIGPSELHSHCAAQIVVHGGAPCVAVGHDVRRGPIVVVPPDVPHAVVDPHDQALVVYVSPESSVGKQLTATEIRDVSSLDAVDPVRHVLGALRMTNWSHADEAVRRTLEHLGIADADHRQPWRHRALNAALLGMPDGIDLHEIDLARLADDTGLSVARMTETMTGGLGVPLGGYVRWLRIVTAIESLVDGADLESAAAVARFPGVDDLSHACTSIFGFDPAALAQPGTWLAAP